LLPALQHPEPEMSDQDANGLTVELKHGMDGAPWLSSVTTQINGGAFKNREPGEEHIPIFTVPPDDGRSRHMGKLCHSCKKMHLRRIFLATPS